MKRLIRTIFTTLYTATAFSFLSSTVYAQSTEAYFIVPKALGLSSLAEADGATLCIGERWFDGGTKLETDQLLSRVLNRFNINVTTVTGGQIGEVFPSFMSGSCDMLYFISDSTSEEGVRSDFQRDDAMVRDELEILHIERF